MKEIIEAIPVEDLKRELTNDCFVRHTINGANDIYIINANTHPCTMREIGRLREMTFRQAGGGTGESCDIDAADTCENGYQQLIVWNPEEDEIIGGYRYYIESEIFNG